MRPFIDDLKEILTHGLEINGNLVSIAVRCFICDTPARCFLKGMFEVFIYNMRIGIPVYIYTYIFLF